MTEADPPGTPRIVGSKGPLTAKQSRAILARLEREAPQSDVLERHIALEQALDSSPLTTGNRTALLRDGHATFDAMFQAIASAKSHINLEYYTLENVEEDGRHLGDLLLRKQAAGVQVNIIYDSIGSDETPPDFFDALRRAGVALLEFHPTNPLAAKAGYSINDRDHRKILVVDGRLAIVGGVNLSKVYGSRIPGEPPQSSESSSWRDTDLEIEGPAVAELQKLFFETWANQDGPPLRPCDYFPPLQPRGKELIRIIGSSPDNSFARYYATIISAIRSAESNIWISAAYFVPTHEEREDLAAAARRGVDVRILVPTESDSEFALDVGRSYYSDLLEAGVKIYELRGKVLHSKTATIDGVWTVIGSSNFDHRSILFNNEVDAIVLGRDTAQQFEAMFRDDFSNSEKIDPAKWEKRPFQLRAKEYLTRIIEILL